MRKPLFQIVLAVLLTLVITVPVFAARADVPVTTPKGPYPVLPVVADSMDFAFTAADATNFNQFKFTGRELLLVTNAHATDAKTFTLESITDDLNRGGDITTYSLAAGEYAAFWAGNLKGWNQAGNVFYLKGSTTDIKFAVIRIP